MHKGSQPVNQFNPVSFCPSDLPVSLVLFSEGPLVVNEIVQSSKSYVHHPCCDRV